uniref:DUF2062 domain-containing protein n=1 Tax=Roseihalotalea indica TaxID=2867963 RepID=A0AA49JD52_9BACT|nr:DUF2062 domain-containing protein [Tunicatimonas sp. TK19036]
MGIQNIKGKLQHFIQRLSQPQTTPQAVALSFALGTLIAILPTPGFGIFVGILLTLLFKSLSKVAMVISITFWNPLLQVPVYYASYLLGSMLLGQPAELDYQESWMTIMVHHTQSFLLGNSILAVLISVAFYWIIYTAFTLNQRKKAIVELLSYHQISKKTHNLT